MSSEVIGPLIGTVGILGAAFVSAYAMWKSKDAIHQKETEIVKLDKELVECLETKVEQTPRKISYQLMLLDHEACKIQKSGRVAQVSILGINATGPLHQGREFLLELLKKGGRLRILLLDPRKPVFEERCDWENDTVGRIRAELFTSLYILIDISSKVGSYARNIEIRLHEKYPDRSLLMLNHKDNDGLILANPYPSEHGKRGMVGEMYPLVQRGRTSESYQRSVQYYESLWINSGTKRIVLKMPHERLQIQDWPFSFATKDENSC